jgi:Arc/MetJ-type ribon-helix-helix transcriptional regulator
MTSKPKRGPGRPPKEGKAMMTPIPVRFPEEMIEAIEAIQAKRMDRPEKSAVIRELVAEALTARKRKGRSP